MMMKRNIYVLLAVLAVSTMAPAAMVEKTDDFGVARDYLTEGVAGTIWDGVVGQGAGETVDAMTANTDRAGQLFIHNAETYVYTYLADRNWHLVARKSRSPVSFQYMRDYNNSLNSGASGSLDTYGLKVMLSYHEYFNNFQGF